MASGDVLLNPATGNRWIKPSTGNDLLESASGCKCPCPVSPPPPANCKCWCVGDPDSSVGCCYDITQTIARVSANFVANDNCRAFSFTKDLPYQASDNTYTLVDGANTYGFAPTCFGASDNSVDAFIGNAFHHYKWYTPFTRTNPAACPPAYSRTFSGADGDACTYNTNDPTDPCANNDNNPSGGNWQAFGSGTIIVTIIDNSSCGGSTCHLDTDCPADSAGTRNQGGGGFELITPFTASDHMEYSRASVVRPISVPPRPARPALFPQIYGAGGLYAEQQNQSSFGRARAGGGGGGRITLPPPLGGTLLSIIYEVLVIVASIV